MINHDWAIQVTVTDYLKGNTYIFSNYSAVMLIYSLISIYITNICIYSLKYLGCEIKWSDYISYTKILFKSK